MIWWGFYVRTFLLQSQTRFLTLRFAEDIEREVSTIPNPLADTTSRRGTKVLLLSERDVNIFHLIQFSGDMLPDGGINTAD